MPRRGENIYKRKDGRWECRILKQDGTYKYLYAKNYREVKSKKNNYKESISKKSVPDELSSAVISFERWLEGDLKKRVKPTTYESYYNTIKKHIIPCYKNMDMKQITPEATQKFSASIKNNDSLSESYKRKILTIYKIAVRDIFNNSEISAAILNSVKIPSVKNPAIEIFSMREQKMIETEIQKSNDYRTLGIILCFYTGIRIGELCALKWKNINFETRMMSIENTVFRTKIFGDENKKTKLVDGTTKSKDSTRIIPVPALLLDRLNDYIELENEENYVLTGTSEPMDPRTYQRIFKRILEKSGVKCRKFHAIRHTFSTRALEVGVDIKTLSEILGHSSALITLNIYAHTMMEQKINAINKLYNFNTSDIDPNAVTGAVK